MLSLDVIRKVAREFIESNYQDEEGLFNAFWDSLSPQISSRMQHASTLEITPISRLTNPSELYFAQGQSFDMVTPIVIATVNETVLNMQKANLSGDKLVDFIAKAAGCFGASKELTANLCRHLPKFCEAVFAESNSIISGSDNNQFQIWANGKSEIVSSIDGFEADKKDCLFWLDLNEKFHVNPKAKAVKLGPAATEILRQMVENLGCRIPKEQICNANFSKNNDLNQVERNRIDQQLVNLQKYSNGKFKQYLYDDWFNYGLGLKTSFVDKYFLYKRIRG